jgi:hypothetical protein
VNVLSVEEVSGKLDEPSDGYPVSPDHVIAPTGIAGEPSDGTSRTLTVLLSVASPTMTNVPPVVAFLSPNSVELSVASIADTPKIT